jgi:predicted transposase/invertase (TIGR01784 family)
MAKSKDPIEKLQQKLSEHADALYHDMFSYPYMVRDLLVYFVKEPWVAQIKWDTLERSNVKFTADKGERREGDIIWTVNLNTGDTLHLILFLEFQSSVDPWMSVRMMSYLSLFLLEWRKTSKDNRLPMVLPIVLYNGDPKWTAKLSVQDLSSQNVPDDLKKYQPKLSYWLLDEKHMALDSVPENHLSPLLAIEKAQFKKDEWGVYDRLKQIVLYGTDEEKNAYRLMALIYTDSKAGSNLKEENLMLAKKLEDMRESLKEHVYQEGLEKGEARGIEKGKAEGKAEGEAKAKLKIVQNLLASGIQKEQALKLVELEESDLLLIPKDQIPDFLKPPKKK